MKAGPLCVLACRWCELPAFQAWAGVVGAEAAKRFVLTTCEVVSRKCLDDGDRAAYRFKTMIRAPFMASQGGRV